MARIEHSLKYITKDRNYVHEIADATYTTFYADNGIKYFQIDTYGTKKRKQPNKLSQTIQFDKETASVIVHILKEQFNL